MLPYPITTVLVHYLLTLVVVLSLTFSVGYLLNRIFPERKRDWVNSPEREAQRLATVEAAGAMYAQSQGLVLVTVPAAPSWWSKPSIRSATRWATFELRDQSGRTVQDGLTYFQLETMVERQQAEAVTS